jgi:hypothetical protein
VSAGPTAAEIADLLALAPHPEGGYFRETFRDAATDETGRARSTIIYFLLAEGQVSAWHRVDATEIWLWHAGAPLNLKVRDADGFEETIPLGADLAAGERPHGVVPAHAWQSAASLGAWTLVSCVVAPGFEFEGFELETDG